jgi:hypothetical protein
MVLSSLQVQERIKHPQNASALQDAREHENQIKLHTKTVHKRTKASPYFSQFLRWVESAVRLPDDKFEAFKEMCQFPLATNELLDDIFNEYERVFSATDGVTEIVMPDASQKAEFERYIRSMGMRSYFRNEGFKAYKTQPGSIYVIDMPAAQEGEAPTPYFYRIGLTRVRDIEVKDGMIGFVLFQGEPIQYGGDMVSSFIAIDDLTYRVYAELKGANGEKKYMLISESAHNLGYTPATFLMHNPLYDAEESSPVARWSPISPAVTHLDWLLFYKVAERMYETYGPFPILAVPDESCDYTDAARNECSHGIVSVLGTDGQVTETYKCPSCSKNSMAGPGTVYQRPQRVSNDQPELDDPVKITPPDIQSLKYITEKIDYLEWDIYESRTGSKDNETPNEAVNDNQIQSSVEGKRNMLFKIKRDFELTEQFIINTIGKLRYEDSYVACIVNYGEDFLLYTENDLITQYTNAKKAGLPIFMVSAKRSALLKSSARNSPYMQARMQLMNDLEPFADLSLQECQQYQFFTQYPEKFLLKTDFTKYVSIFEMENGDIVEYLTDKSYREKIKDIESKLMQYASEDYSEAEHPTDPAGFGGGAAGGYAGSLGNGGNSSGGQRKTEGQGQEGE